MRRPLTITIISTTGALVLGLLFTNAHNSPLDELGCHRDPPGSRYHCHTGALKGKEFANKEQAQRTLASVHTQNAANSDFDVTYEDTPEAAREKELNNLNLPSPEQPPKAVVNEKLLKVISWNVRKREKVDFDRIVNVLAEADIAALQDLDLDEKGKGPLHIVADLLELRIGEKICRMWFKNNAQGRERYGVLWRNSTIGYVNPTGEIKDNCGEMAVVVPTNKAKTERLLATAQFFSKVQKKMFQLGTVDLDSRPSMRDVLNLFKPLETSTWPTIIVGDVKFPTYDIKNWNFKSNLRQSSKASGNIWTRNAVVVRGIYVNLHERFKELPAQAIENTVSSSFPMLAEVALTSEVNDQLATLIIKSKKEPAKKGPAKAKVVGDRASGDKFQEPKDDIEAEAKMAEAGDSRTPASNKKNKKKNR